MISIHKTLAPKQLFSLVFLILIGTAVTLGQNLDRNGWFSLIIALILSIPLYMLVLKINSKGDKQNIFDRIEFTFGSFLSKIILLILLLFALFGAVFSLDSFIVFIKTMSMSGTNGFVIGAFIMFSVILFAKSGVLQLGRWAEPVFWIVLIFLLSSIFMTIPSFKTENLFPLFYDGFNTPIRGGIYLFLFFFTDIVFLLFMIDNREKKYFKPVRIASILSSVLLITVFLRNMFLLGYAIESSISYPSYVSASLISLGKFFERGEVLVSIPFVLCDLLKISVFVIFAKNSLLSIKHTLDQKNIAIVLCTIVFAAGSVLSEFQKDFTDIKMMISVVIIAFTLIFTPIFLIKTHILNKKENKHGS